MKPEEQRIVIAEACGFVPMYQNCSWETQVWHVPGGTFDKLENCRVFESLPDYLNDLNAMHEAEGRHDFDMHNNRYGRILAEVVTRQSQGHHHITANWWTVKRVARATAAQRAEAFIRTIGKWNTDA